MTRATLQIQGMTCGHCVEAVRRALATLPGVEVQSVKVGQADISFDQSVASPALLTEAVRNAGYSASLSDVGA